mgnify:CR=1 FL=1
MPIELFVGIGVVFGFFGGLVAFLITLNEWTHHYQTLREPVKMALRTGFFAFMLFFLLSIALGFILPYVLT